MPPSSFCIRLKSAVRNRKTDTYVITIVVFLTLQSSVTFEHCRIVSFSKQTSNLGLDLTKKNQISQYAQRAKQENISDSATYFFCAVVSSAYTRIITACDKGTPFTENWLLIVKICNVQ